MYPKYCNSCLGNLNNSAICIELDICILELRPKLYFFKHQQGSSASFWTENNIASIQCMFVKFEEWLNFEKHYLTTICFSFFFLFVNGNKNDHISVIKCFYFRSDDDN